MGIVQPKTALLSFSGKKLKRIVPALVRQGMQAVLQIPRRGSEWLASALEHIVFGALAHDGADRDYGTDAILGVVEHFEMLPTSVDGLMYLRASAIDAVLTGRHKIYPDGTVDEQLPLLLSIVRRAFDGSGLYRGSAVDSVIEELLDEWQHVRPREPLAHERLDAVLERIRPLHSMRATTIHQAKGLEFDAVALLDVDIGCLPFGRSPTQHEYQEELRKFYVAITRAKQLLWLQSGVDSESPFVDLVSEHCPKIEAPIMVPEPGASLLV
jgi:hypothetical protein